MSDKQICKICGNEIDNANRYSEHYQWDECINGLKSKVTRLQSELDAEREKHRWIPVEERLPDEGKDVIVGGRNFTGCMSLDYGGTTLWRNSVGWLYADITHWQPLPQPPEDDK
jgi:hypothetical protein